MSSMGRLARLVAALAVLAILGMTVRIDDCCCDTETVDLANQRHLHSLLEKIRATRFFKIFQLNLYNPCKFWTDESLCSSPKCSVCECTDEVPELWKSGDSLDMKLPQFEHWTEEDGNWIVQDTGTMTFINLQRNPESYTGYSGEAARKVWAAMYGENCFQDRFTDMCYEKRVFFRLLSGLQACISAHVSYNHPLGDGLEWGPDPAVFNRLLGRHPDRIQNIYFVFVFLLRAVNKMSGFLSSYDYRTGNDPVQIAEDIHTKTLVQNLLHAPMVQQCSPDYSFNEKNMFRDLDSEHIKTQLKSHFRNLSLIMDCVHCDKCRVHGKLQILGIGTALKILFNDAKHLQRNEITALINTLGKFSHGIWITQEMQRLSKLSWISIGTFTIFLLIAITSTFCVCVRLITSRSADKTYTTRAKTE